MQQRALVSWSGGKDSFFACVLAKEAGLSPYILLTVLNEEGRISRSHGIPAPILEAQARSLGLPIHLISSSWQQYEEKFTAALSQIKEAYGLTHAVFGDIDLEDHRLWEEKVCTRAGLTAHLPLWQKNRKDLVLQMLDYGIRTLIVSCNEAMGKGYLGQLLTPELVTELEEKGIDPCGENGEYHTLVVDAPHFSYPLDVSIADTKLHDRYWFAQLHLQGQ